MVYHATRNAVDCRIEQLQASCLVDLLNLRTVVGSGGSTSTGARHATGHTTLGTASLLVECSPVKTLANSSEDRGKGLIT